MSEIISIIVLLSCVFISSCDRDEQVERLIDQTIEQRREIEDLSRRMNNCNSSLSTLVSHPALRLSSIGYYQESSETQFKGCMSLMNHIKSGNGFLSETSYKFCDRYKEK